MAKKDLFIHTIQQVEVDAAKNIPTAVYYKTADTYMIGYEAHAATGDPLEINQDFKVDLGRHDTTLPKQNQRFPTANGEGKSAYVMTQDFITGVLHQVSYWLTMQHVEEAAHVLIAEPLAMHEEEDSRWLENYRRNLRQMLEGRTNSEMPNIRPKEVSFLPEPFAVFQYYRYGINHPLMAQAAKHQALILDFGGGTFDVCVIETTKDGDISRSGRNSKPFGASSEPVGGFFVNRKLAEHLYRQHLISSARRNQFKQGLSLYGKWRRNELDLATTREDYRAFVLNFHRTSFELEAPKITLCKQVNDWTLDAPLSAKTMVRLPSDPFAESSPSKSVPFSATEMREVFTREVWEKRLRGTVDLCLKRAMQDLRGEPITLVLLSGGSANIGWLRTALFENFSHQLSSAQSLSLPDFQEVVSKGLAVECARRFYTESGDFGSVVYNRLCLMLDVNKGETSSDCRPRPFKPLTANLPNTSDQPGVLLQSASAIRTFIDQPMRWRVGQVGAQPKKLDYYFLRSSTDPEDLESRLNFEETTALAPSKCQFDQDLKVELIVREDGTAIPRFIYHTGRTESETVLTEGKPFALDVTLSASTPNAKAYIGFDFGTSNSSVSFVESRSVKEYERRRGEGSWRELGDLAYELPYPISDPLLAYLSETTNKERLNNAGRQAFEAMLTLIFYAAIADYRWHRQQEGNIGKSRLFGQLSQRSAGPLWGSLRQLFTQQGFGKRATFTSPAIDMFEGDTSTILNSFVDFVAQTKHDKSAIGSTDLHRPLHTLANICNRIFRKAQFGFFENLRAPMFSKTVAGQFRVAHGQTPFIKTCEVRIQKHVPQEIAYLFSAELKIALPLSPLVFWWQDPKAQMLDHGCCYVFDFAAKDNQSFSFKTVGRADQLTVSQGRGQMAMLAQELAAERIMDGPIEALEVSLFTCEDT